MNRRSRSRWSRPRRAPSAGRRFASAAPLAAALLVMGCGSEPAAGPFAADVVSFSPGPGAGFGQDALPDVVLGPPHGAGESRGSTDVLSLGDGGEIVLELGREAVDRAGADVIVFENAFRFGAGLTFVEPAAVAFSEDGVHFVESPCDTTAPYAGCAGLSPVFANPEENDLDPLDPAAAGGDAFDLADVGLPRARYVRVRDLGLALGPPSPDAAGADLDAVAVIHSAP